VDVRARGVVCRPALMLTFSTLLMIATLKITALKWQHCKFDTWGLLLL